MNGLRRIYSSISGPCMHDIRRLFTSNVRPIITYACGAWFIERGDKIDPNDRNPPCQAHSLPFMPFGIAQRHIDILDSLQSACLWSVSGSYYNVPGRVLEKEIFVHSIQIYLRTAAAASRARTVHTSTSKMLESRRTETLQPHCILRRAALAVDDSARKRMPEEDQPTTDEAWAVSRKRVELIREICHEKATQQNSALWDFYRIKYEKKIPINLQP